MFPLPASALRNISTAIACGRGRTGQQQLLLPVLQAAALSDPCSGEAISPQQSDNLDTHEGSVQGMNKGQHRPVVSLEEEDGSKAVTGQLN